MISIRDFSGTLRSVITPTIRDGSDVSRPIVSARVRDATGVLRTVYQQLGATVSTETVYGTANSTTITTGPCQAIPVSGQAPYTYAWSRTDGGPDTWTILAPTTATTAFRATSVFDEATAAFVCVITDHSGATAVTPTVAADAINPV